MHPTALIGIGLYTPREAARLIGVPAKVIIRRLKGHSAGGQSYPPLWTPQVALDDDDGLYLGFRDLMEMRVAQAFIGAGLSAIKVRRAIEIARAKLGLDHPLSTTRFRTDGQAIFVELAEEDGGDPKLLEIFSGQLAFKRILAPSLKDLDFDDGLTPSRWWPAGKAKPVVVDPTRSFGRPVEAESGVPTAILASAAEAEGGVERAAKVWDVPAAAIRAAIEFERGPAKIAA